MAPSPSCGLGNTVSKTDFLLLPAGSLQLAVFYNREVRVAVILVALCSPALAQWWSVQTSGLATNLRGVSVSSAATSEGTHCVVWASGSHGVILRSTNSGSTWKQLHV